MRKICATLFWFCVLSLQGFAENRSQFALEASFDRVLLRYDRSFIGDCFLAGLQTGPANQDNEAIWNDWMARLLLTLPVHLSVHHQLNVSAGPGLYLPLVKECTPVTSFVSTSLQYCFYPGKMRHTFVSFTAGYQYGQRSYIQTAGNQYFSTEFRPVFKLPALELTAGFGFCW